jgi:hypothetical protein
MTSTRRPHLWCDRCGQALSGEAQSGQVLSGEALSDDARSGGAHAACVAARAFEPPRFCPWCRRRMVVQVLPYGWTARCIEHGSLGSA